MTIRTEIAKVLETTEKNLNARLVGLKIAPVCSRCGGSGRYSYNQIDGDKCFGCGGAGHTVPKDSDLPAIFDAAVECANDGRLAAYLRYLEASRIVKNAGKTVLDAWTATGVSGCYDWRKAAEFMRTGNTEFKRDCDISEINRKMCDAYQAVNTFAMRLNPKSETYREDVIKLSGMVETAIATVETAKAELDAYLETNPLA